MGGLASAVLFTYRKRRGSRVYGHRRQRGGGNLVVCHPELGMLNLRYLGDIFVEIPSQQFEAQSSFQCRFRVRWHSK